jgi:group II intron reverse transcriptase/maturase
LNAIYEEDFLGFSYGFRPGRGPHNALDAVTVGINRKKVSFVLDADIRGFYDAVDHEWLVKFVEHRIGDERVVRHIKKWLNAGVLEDGKRMQTTVGTPQGSSVSPVLANIYLHYAFDQWAHQWRQRKARGEVIIVRYADDIVMGFQYRDDAERFRQEMEERLARFKLELHPDKTRLVEFGRFAAEDRKKRGEGKPETFDFLGFTHICGKTRKGKFAVLRKTIRKRMCAKLKALKEELKARMHNPIPIVGNWLASVLRGHFQYYGVPRNTYSISAFRRAVICLWKQAISRRSQNGQITWSRMSRLAKTWLPTARIQHPYPEQRLRV